MYQIELTPEAIADLKSLRKFDRQVILQAIEGQLAHQPDLETRHRKRLRPNRLAEWELRVDRFRVFYDVVREDQRIHIVALGFKQGNTLFIHGEEYLL